MKGIHKGLIIAEVFGVLTLLTVIWCYIAAIGGYIISGVGLFLIPISVVVYEIITPLQFALKIPQKSRWIMFVSKIAFIIALLLLSPLICDLAAWLVNRR